MSKISDEIGNQKGTLYFMVLEDGSEADIFTEFENQEFGYAMLEAASKTIKGVKWKPATQNGVNIKRPTKTSHYHDFRKKSDAL